MERRMLMKLTAAGLATLAQAGGAVAETAGAATPAIELDEVTVLQLPAAMRKGTRSTVAIAHL